MMQSRVSTHCIQGRMMSTTEGLLTTMSRVTSIICTKRKSSMVAWK